jgi:nicotinamidase-related amidase/uncharacterized glyoxalase superfamily protein PhnB
MMVAIVVRDYDEAIAWYRDVLGCSLVEDSRLEGEKRWVVMAPPGGGTLLLLARAANDAQRARVGDQTGGRVFLFLHTDDFARDHARLSSLGVRLVDGPRQEPYGTVGVFEDLYGNRWDLIERRRTRTVLLVIDLQEDFVGKLADPPRVVARVAALVEEARGAGVPVVWIRGRMGGAILLQPGDGELVVEKPRYSGFFGTALDAHLARLGARTLVMCGVNTHACVRTTAIDAFQRDYLVTIVRDAIDSYDVEHAAVTLRYLDGKLVQIVDRPAW